MSALLVYDLQGKPINLNARLRWKVITFWSTACPCAMQCQENTLIPLWKRYGKQIDFCAIASNDANLGYEKEKIYLKLPGDPEQRPPYPLLLDKHHALADALQATNTPQTFLLSPENRLAFMGDPDNSSEVKEGKISRHYLRDAIQESLQNRKISCPVAPSLGCQIDRSQSKVEKKRSQEERR